MLESRIWGLKCGSVKVFPRRTGSWDLARLPYGRCPSSFHRANVDGLGPSNNILERPREMACWCRFFGFVQAFNRVCEIPILRRCGGRWSRQGTPCSIFKFSRWHYCGGSHQYTKWQGETRSSTLGEFYEWVFPFPTLVVFLGDEDGTWVSVVLKRRILGYPIPELNLFSTYSVFEQMFKIFVN